MVYNISLLAGNLPHVLMFRNDAKLGKKGIEIMNAS